MNRYMKVYTSFTMGYNNGPSFESLGCLQPCTHMKYEVNQTMDISSIMIKNKYF